MNKKERKAKSDILNLIFFKKKKKKKIFFLLIKKYKKIVKMWLK